MRLLLLSMLTLLAGVLGLGVATVLWSLAAESRYLLVNAVAGIVALLFSAASVAMLLVGLLATLANLVTLATRLMA